VLRIHTADHPIPLELDPDLNDVLGSVEENARSRLRTDRAFAAMFQGEHDAYVLCVDIRRSTELMLKATSPALYAAFITQLCTALRAIVWAHHGIFDRFTGDGILAFFPTFYSGDDAGYLALSAAAECHAAFHELYQRSRHCFDVVIKDAGLGIGIDFGSTHLLRHWGSLTVMGKAVVYACRMSGARSGDTLVNQRAYAQLVREYPDHCEFEETEIDIKHEGAMLAHRVRLRDKSLDPRPPGWFASDDRPISGPCDESESADA
jgi:class 3 adenylate cyclase